MVWFDKKHDTLGIALKTEKIGYIQSRYSLRTGL